MPVGAVVVDEIHDDAHVALLRLGDQLLHVGERAEVGMDAAVVADVVAVVDHGGRIDGREPQCARAERLQVVELFRDAADVARALAARVVEALGIDLVDGGVLPPMRCFHAFFLSIHPPAAGRGMRDLPCVRRSGHPSCRLLPSCPYVFSSAGILPSSSPP